MGKVVIFDVSLFYRCDGDPQNTASNSFPYPISRKIWLEQPYNSSKAHYRHSINRILHSYTQHHIPTDIGSFLSLSIRG